MSDVTKIRRDKASHFLEELETKNIPHLRKEKERLFKERLSLGLKRDPSDALGQRYAYPKPLSKPKAYLLARERLEKAPLSSLRASVKRAERIIKALELKLFQIEEKLKHEGPFKRLNSREGRRKASLKERQARVEKRYLEVNINYLSQLTLRRSSSFREKIKGLQEELLKRDLHIQEKRSAVELRYSEVALELKDALNLRHDLLKLGELNVHMVNTRSKATGHMLLRPAGDLKRTETLQSVNDKAKLPQKRKNVIQL